MERKSNYSPRLIVHFVRHAESLHKSPHCTNPESLVDPGLSKKGISDCVKFSNNFKDAERITHMLCSPMLRSRQTAALAFSKISPALVSNVVALPHLQTVGAGPNNTGSSVKDMEIYEKLRFTKSKNSIPMDVATFCDQSWIEKDSGRWSSKSIPWRVDFMRGLLSGIWIGCGMKRAEVLVVTHGSFLRSLLNDGNSFSMLRYYLY
ncbi:hypothetical protein K3495_g8583 [Podosphaera aphanis]|nr:hypothetical protein K3495_g8583 [Podosphaera aphanis]